MKRKMLDLCSGFGGQSEYFLRDFEVLRIDNNPLLVDIPETVIMDLYDDQLLKHNGTRIEYVHAGPTCLEFSTGFNAPRGIAQRAGLEYWPTEGIRLVNRCKAIIDILKPRFWSIENVKGSIIYLTPILGEPRLIIGPYVYWGNFPLFEFDASSIPHKSAKDKRHSPLRMNYRACAPIEISKAFHDAISGQRSILEY